MLVVLLTDRLQDYSKFTQLTQGLQSNFVRFYYNTRQTIFSLQGNSNNVGKTLRACSPSNFHQKSLHEHMS